MPNPESTVRSKSVEIVTFGCRLNAFESEVIRDATATAGLADAVVINTCGVTAEAERQARQAIRRARRQRPGTQIVVTGCAAQLKPESFAAMPEVDRVLGNREKLKPASFTTEAPTVLVNDIMAAREGAAHLIHGFEERVRAFVEIQNGCDHRCTFCIIPFARGNNRSVAAGTIVDQVRTLVARGYREIVLTGVDIASYGADLPGNATLGRLVRQILKHVPELPRLRLSTLDPATIDHELLNVFATEQRLMPHVHLSLQAGSDLILKRMKRRHDSTQARKLCQRLRISRPDVVFGADIIAGFPTEGEAEFNATLTHIGDCGITYLHVFPYSERNGTPAARMPQVPVPVRKERAARLRYLGETRLGNYLAAQIGTTTSILVERPDIGRTPHYATMSFRVAAATVPPCNGEIVTVTVSNATDTALVGTLAA